MAERERSEDPSMLKTVEIIKGDTPGAEWQFSVLRFAGSDPTAPSAYLQAALHGNELPGVVALHFLVPMLEAAEAEGRLRGDVTVLPYANPIAAGQHLFQMHAGRYAFNSRTNFNRDFPLLPDLDTSGLPGPDAHIAADIRLKARLVQLALGHDLVLDLHCDDESLSYLYVARPFWPHLDDLATCLGCPAVLIWEGGSDGAFEEAAFSPYAGLPDEDAGWKRRAVTTVELRGRADVSEAFATADAEGLYRFLVARGTVVDAGIAPLEAWSGEATPLERVEVVRAPASGAVLFHARPGDRVEAGAPLVTILTAPGEAGGTTVVTAPQAGLVLTRSTERFARLGGDLVKLLGSVPSATAKSGALES